MRVKVDWPAGLLGLVVLGLIITAEVIWSDEVQTVNETVFDQFQNWKPREYNPDSPVRVIDIDDRSLAEFGQWPWPRTYMAEMLRRLTNAGVAAIALDITFVESDRTSPETLLDTLGRFGGDYDGLFVEMERRREQNALPDHDADLSWMISQTPTIVGTIATDNPLTDRMPPQPKGIGVSGDGGDIRPVVQWFEGATPNLEVLSRSASGVGTIALAKDEGTIIRRVPLIVAIGDNEFLYPSLSIEALRVAQGAQSFLVKTTRGSGEVDLGGDVQIASMRVGGAIVPLDRDGQLRVHYSPARDERVVSAIDLLVGDDTPPEIAEEVAGRIIFVGSSAESLFDIKATPLHDRISGVHIHAEIVEQIIDQTWITRSDEFIGLERLGAIVLGIVVAAFLALNLPLTAFLFMIVASGAVAAGSWFAFAEEAQLYSPLMPMLGLIIPHFTVSGYKFFTAEASRREVTRQFEHFVAPEVIEDIIEDPERYLTPGGDQRVLSIMFLDVRRFSTITEKMEPQEVIAFINKLLTPLTDVIIENEGTIDKYMGDAVMAFWNAPRFTQGHEAKAVRAILAFDPIMEALNREFTEMGLPDIDIGVGVNTGECSVGNMGSLKRLAYSCVGDSVNLAARLEGQTKAYGVRNLIGSATAAGLPCFAAIEIDSVAVKGRTQPETIYTVAGDETVAADPAYDLVAASFGAARFAYLEQDWDTAEAAYREVAGMPPVGAFDPGPCAAIFLERIAQYRSDPPPPDWDGVYVATSK
ncbi:MAG: adenylate/guanylate cyclase domain-containing protein [Pseudomonadota bacterium]